MFDEYRHYRHEFKYIEPERRLFTAERRISAIMSRDIHAGESGVYGIRSLYFDDYYDSKLYDNITGVDQREKWRIRIYNKSSDYISLERKLRRADMISKDSCPISPEMYERIIMRTAEVSDGNPPLLNVFIVRMRTCLLRPAIIVEYDRTPFADPKGNTRVTFDRNIRSSQELDALLADRDLSSRPVLEYGQNLLEVKFDGFLPDHIGHALETGHMHRNTFSKYFLCRRYTLNGSSAKYTIPRTVHMQ